MTKQKKRVPDPSGSGTLFRCGFMMLSSGHGILFQLFHQIYKVGCDNGGRCLGDIAYGDQIVSVQTLQNAGFIGPDHGLRRPRLHLCGVDIVGQLTHIAGDGVLRLLRIAPQEGDQLLQGDEALRLKNRPACFHVMVGIGPVHCFGVGRIGAHVFKIGIDEGNRSARQAVEHIGGKAAADRGLRLEGRPGFAVENTVLHNLLHRVIVDVIRRNILIDADLHPDHAALHALAVEHDMRGPVCLLAADSALAPVIPAAGNPGAEAVNVGVLGLPIHDAADGAFAIRIAVGVQTAALAAGTLVPMAAAVAGPSGRIDVGVFGRQCRDRGALGEQLAAAQTVGVASVSGHADLGGLRVADLGAADVAAAAADLIIWIGSAADGAFPVGEAMGSLGAARAARAYVPMAAAVAGPCSAIAVGVSGLQRRDRGAFGEPLAAAQTIGVAGVSGYADLGGFGVADLGTADVIAAAADFIVRIGGAADGAVPSGEPVGGLITASAADALTPMAAAVRPPCIAVAMGVFGHQRLDGTAS